MDDSADKDVYIGVFKASRFDVISPRKIGTLGKQDKEHLQIASSLNATVLTFDEDFGLVHEDFKKKGKNHNGILIVYQYNNPYKDMKPSHIVKAIKNIISLNLPIQNNLYNLNQFKY